MTKQQYDLEIVVKEVRKMKKEETKKTGTNEHLDLRIAVGESSVTITPEQTIIEGKTVRISPASGEPV